MERIIRSIAAFGFVLNVYAMFGQSASIQPAIKEYCQNEVFTAGCPPDSVVVMITSGYGMMQMNRCINKDYGFVGCKSDVLGVTDLLCSGRRNCSVRVPNELFDNEAQATCPTDFKHYLEASYECMKVVPGKKHSCDLMTVLTAPEGTISNQVTMETNCGSHSYPWRIELLPGQRINVTLVDFAHALKRLSKSSTDLKSGATCFAYAILKEPSSSQSSTICGSKTESREAEVYVSKGERLQINILPRNELDSQRYFILKYKAIGCGHPVAPSGGWVRPRGNEVTVGCNYSSTTWTMTCVGYKWTGNAGNCTIPENSLRLTTLVTGPNISFGQFEMAIMSVVVIALMIASVILCIGVLYIKRQGQRNKPCLEMMQASGGPIYEPTEWMSRQYDPEQMSEQYKDLNDYAYIDANPHPLASSSALQHNPSSCRHVILPCHDNTGHVVCEISRPSRTPTPYSTLDQNTDSLESGLQMAGDAKMMGKFCVQKCEKIGPRDCRRVEKPCQDLILGDCDSAKRSLSYQMQGIL